MPNLGSLVHPRGLKETLVVHWRGPDVKVDGSKKILPACKPSPSLLASYNAVTLQYHKAGFARLGIIIRPSVERREPSDLLCRDSRPRYCFSMKLMFFRSFINNILMWTRKKISGKEALRILICLKTPLFYQNTCSFLLTMPWLTWQENENKCQAWLRGNENFHEALGATQCYTGGNCLLLHKLKVFLDFLWCPRCFTAILHQCATLRGQLPPVFFTGNWKIQVFLSKMVPGNYFLGQDGSTCV